MSVTLYVTSYLPGLVVSTSFFNTSILSVISPSSSSSAVTSALSSNLSPTVRVLSVALITGHALRTAAFGLTVTLIVVV